MQACDVIRYLALTIRDNCASVKYSDDGGRLDISGAWAYAPADGYVEIDAETAASAGALVLVCFDAGGVSRRVDLSAFFGRG